MTDNFENITLARTSFAGGKNSRKSTNAKSKDNLLKLETISHGLVCSIVKEVNEHARSDFLVEAERLCIHTIRLIAVSSSQSPIQSDYKTVGAGPEITNPMGAGPEITNPWVQDLRLKTPWVQGLTLQTHGCRTWLPIQEITNPVGAGPEITNPWMQDLRLQIHGCRA